MNLTGVTARYARAFLEAAEEQRALDRVRDDAEALLDLLSTSEELRDFVLDPLIQAEGKQKALESLFSGKVHEVTLGFLRLLCANRRERGLEEMLKGVQHLLDERQGVATAEVRSAHALSDSQRQELLRRLSSVSGKQVRLDETVDDSLKAGFVVRLEDRVFDGTITAQLDRLRRNLIRQS